MKYGINNAIGRQPTKSEVFAMLDVCAQNPHIKFLDTAAAYGTAEDWVGEWGGGRIPFSITTKIQPWSAFKDTITVSKAYDIFCSRIDMSMKRLKINNLYGIMLHTPTSVFNDNLVEALLKIKADIPHVGISAYHVEEADCAINMGLNLLQFPHNALDQRFCNAGIFSKAESSEVKVFARSPFLQGLLTNEQVPPDLPHERIYLKVWSDLCNKYGLKLYEGALLYALSKTDCPLVFGVETLSQLKENLSCLDQEIDNRFVDEIDQYFVSVAQNVFMPSLWTIQGKGGGKIWE